MPYLYQVRRGGGGGGGGEFRSSWLERQDHEGSSVCVSRDAKEIKLDQTRNLPDACDPVVGACLADTPSAQGVSLSCYSQDGKVKCCHPETPTAPQTQLPKMLPGGKNLAKKLRQWYQFTVARSIQLLTSTGIMKAPGPLSQSEAPNSASPHDKVLTMAAMNGAG